METVWSEPNWL